MPVDSQILLKRLEPVVRPTGVVRTEPVRPMEQADFDELLARAGRGELADKERAEMAIIEEFMPAALSEEELEGLIRAAIGSTGAKGMQDMGNVMNELRPQVTGRVDMGQLSKMVRAALAG